MENLNPVLGFVPGCRHFILQKNFTNVDEKL